MPVEHTPEGIAEAIRPTLDAFTRGAAPYLKRITDELYEQLLNSTQDYLRENGEWNIGEDIARCRRVDAENQRLRAVNAELLAVLTTCDDAIREMFRYFDGGETRGSYDGRPERDQLRKAGYTAAAAIARATQETPHAG